MGELVHALTLGPRALFPLVGATLQAALAVFLVVTARGPRVRLWFAVASFSASVWAVSAAVARATSSAATAHWAAQLAFAAIAIGGPSSFGFGAYLTARHTRLVAPVLAGGMGVAVLALCAPSLTRCAPLAGGGFWPRPCPAFWLTCAAAVPPAIGGLAIVYRGWRALGRGRRRRQLQWSWAALAMGALGTVDVGTVLGNAPPIAWLTGTLSSILLFYALVQPRLSGLRRLVRQSLLGAFGAVAGALLVGGLVALGLRGDGPSRALVGASVLVTFGLARLWVGHVEPALERVIGWRRGRIDAAWSEFARSALDARTPAGVQRRLAHALEAALEARLVAVVPLAHPFPLGDAVRRLRVPVLRDLTDADEPDGPALLAALDRLGADALLPLVRDDQLLAVVAVAGPQLQLADDALVEDLVALCAHAAGAWLNATLYEEVARRSAGLEAQVRLRTIELERAVVELTEAQVKLAESERSSSLGLLVAGVSHEINNALNFISANLPTLERYLAAYEQLFDAAERAGHALDAAAARARAELPASVAALAEATRRTCGIVADLRRFARPDAERRLLDVADGLDGALNLLRRRTDGRITVLRRYAEGASIEGYPGPLNQCFFNVLLNAVEAARAQISVVVRTVDEGVEVMISDDGPGIAAEDTDVVFRPFYTTKPKAAGLGLTVARGIVERHGGSIRMESIPGHGATTHIRLPSHAREAPPPRDKVLA